LQAQSIEKQSAFVIIMSKSTHPSPIHHKCMWRHAESNYCYTLSHSLILKHITCISITLVIRFELLLSLQLLIRMAILKCSHFPIHFRVREEKVFFLFCSLTISHCAEGGKAASFRTRKVENGWWWWELSFTFSSHNNVWVCLPLVSQVIG
jgi:hypothetical protein